MAAPRTTTWELEPHTRAKHEILKRYLQAWAPILSHGGFPEILYIDGFAGPGNYSNGDEGSPVIALRAALQQGIPPTTHVRFLFVERDPDRARVLQDIIANFKLPPSFRVDVAGGSTFEVEASELLTFYRSPGKKFPPTFAFIDPFGWTGVPFSLLREILRQPSCEVLVNFMYEEVNRFLAQPDQPSNFDKFFGTPDWRDCRTGSPEQRNRCLHDLYAKQLRAIDREMHVRSFEMKNDARRTDYYLFYATKSLKGLQKMKEAMWKVDATGEFVFSDATDVGQLVMFGAPAFDILREQLIRRFAGHDATVREVEEFVITETAFRETHYKRQVLAPLEASSKLTVMGAATKRRPGTYADPRLLLRFHPGPPLSL